MNITNSLQNDAQAILQEATSLLEELYKICLVLERNVQQSTSYTEPQIQDKKRLVKAIVNSFQSADVAGKENLDIILDRYLIKLSSFNRAYDHSFTSLEIYGPRIYQILMLLDSCLTKLDSIIIKIRKL